MGHWADFLQTGIRSDNPYLHPELCDKVLGVDHKRLTRLSEFKSINCTNWLRAKRTAMLSRLLMADHEGRIVGIGPDHAGLESK